MAAAPKLVIETNQLITVYVTRYLRGREQSPPLTLAMPQVPVADQTMHFAGRAWRVSHVSWVMAEEGDFYGTPGRWHAEIAVSA